MKRHEIMKGNMVDFTKLTQFNSNLEIQSQIPKLKQSRDETDISKITSFNDDQKTPNEIKILKLERKLLAIQKIIEEEKDNALKSIDYKSIKGTKLSDAINSYAEVKLMIKLSEKINCVLNSEFEEV